MPRSPGVAARVRMADRIMRDRVFASKLIFLLASNRAFCRLGASPRQDDRVARFPASVRVGEPEEDEWEFEGLALFHRSTRCT
jgi:hypothetical protein